MTATDREISAIRDAAADWVVQLNDGALSAADRKAFSEWLRRSPTHVREYLRAESAWQAMAGVAKEDSSDVRAVLAGAMPNVVELPARAQEAGSPSRRWLVRRPALAAAAAVVLAVGVLFGPGLIERLDSNAYSTARGELRHVVLPDGSSFDLNTQSRIRIRMDRGSRDVYLRAGEAYFQVAKDPSRPFRVHSDDTVIHALGTQFNVYRKTNGTAVTVVEGLVAVSPVEQDSPASPASKEDSAENSSLKLKAGEGAFVRRHADAADKPTLQAVPVDPRRAVSWRQQRLVFENEPLATVVAEFNRYNGEQLAIEDPQLAATRVSGVFNARRPLALVDFLTQHGDVRATRRAGSRILLSRP